jgi:hypothetical protein
MTVLQVPYTLRLRFCDFTKMMNSITFLTNFVALAASALLLTAAPPAHAQLPAPGNKILSFDELRSCLLTRKRNEEESASVKKEQEAFRRDHDAIKAEQVEISKFNETLNQEQAKLTTDRQAIDARTVELRAMAEAAKTDEEKAKYNAEVIIHIERGDKHDDARAQYRARQETYNERIAAFNAKLSGINARSKSVNDRVEPLLKADADWRAACSNRRFHEEDEKELKKELKL